MNKEVARDAAASGIGISNIMLKSILYLLTTMPTYIPGFYLRGAGVQGGSFPPKMSIFPPNIFISLGKTLLSNSHTLAIYFLSAIYKVQSSKVCHRVNINRNC